MRIKDEHDRHEDLQDHGPAGPEGQEPPAATPARPRRPGVVKGVVLSGLLLVNVGLRVYRVMEAQADEEREVDASELVEIQQDMDEARCLADRVSQGLPLVATDPSDPAYYSSDPLDPCGSTSGLGG